MAPYIALNSSINLKLARIFFSCCPTTRLMYEKGNSIFRMNSFDLRRYGKHSRNYFKFLFLLWTLNSFENLDEMFAQSLGMGIVFPLSHRQFFFFLHLFLLKGLRICISDRRFRQPIKREGRGDQKSMMAASFPFPPFFLFHFSVKCF